jgi:hypothetical protein
VVVGPDANRSPSRIAIAMHIAIGIHIAIVIHIAIAVYRIPVSYAPRLAAGTKGFYDVFGSAWEWGEDHYAAYPGFKASRGRRTLVAACAASLISHSV